MLSITGLLLPDKSALKFAPDITAFSNPLYLACPYANQRYVPQSMEAVVFRQYFI
jgi:hypothetical protein